MGKEKQQIDLKKFKFPDTVSKVFSTVNTDPKLLAEAKARGFYDGDTPYNTLFSNLFFQGGKIKFKEGLDSDFKTKAWTYCRALMSSFAPKHEHKEAVCAMLMSELLEPLEKS